jgi:hypothetical protein
VCVRGATAVHPEAISATLRHAEAALETYLALGLPPPLADGWLGGDERYDIYLQRGAEPVTTVDLVPVLDTFDRASAFTVLAPAGVRPGCAAASEVARHLAHAVLLGMDAGAEAGALSMAASYLASLAVPCTPVETVAIDDLQRHPERELTAGDPNRPDGAMLFPAYLDEAWGNGKPAGVITALLTVSHQRTPAGAWSWSNEPDVFDALRLAAKDRDTSIGDMLLELAVARAFVGSRSDEGHLRDVARFGDAGRVRFEWAVPFSSLPRRLAPLRPISSTGSTYLWLDLKDAPADAGITFVAEWELPVLFQWALVKVDAEGKEVGRVGVAPVYGSTRAERTVLNLSGLAGLLIVGINQGDFDRGAPFDPDEGPFEPHAYTVTLHKQ